MKNFNVNWIVNIDKKTILKVTGNAIYTGKFSKNEISNNSSSENVIPENKVVEEQVSNEDDKKIDGVNPLKDLLKDAASEFINDEVKSSALSNIIGESQLKEEIKETVPEENKEEPVLDESDEKVGKVEETETSEKEEIDIEKVKGTYEVNIVSDNEIASQLS